MEAEEIEKIVERQRAWFESGATLDLSLRAKALARLKETVRSHEQEIQKALCADLGKGRFESYMCETGLTMSEITYMQKHLKKFASEKTVHTPLAQFHARSYKKPSPYGVVLVMSPWNYPILLTLDPLADAIAAGNTVVVKPSAYSPNTSAVIAKIIEECFSPEHVAVVTGGRKENTHLLNQKFDYIFFTGSQAVGREVMRKAAENLTPVTLELGGKSPCIVDRSANIKLAAKRIVFGKYLNCGQTCVAPDFVYCHESVKDQLLEQIKFQIREQFGDSPLDNKDYGKIISEKHFRRISGLLDDTRIVFGGKKNPDTLQIEPTVMDHVTFGDAVMQEEIFGPVMPILTFSSLEEVIEKVKALPHPLALYVFAEDKAVAKKVMDHCGFGGGCINDTIIHLATSELGFGGFGESGMGAYHGKSGFDTFSHYKSIVDKKTWLDLPMRYQPYRKFNEKLVRFFLR